MVPNFHTGSELTLETSSFTRSYRVQRSNEHRTELVGRGGGHYVLVRLASIVDLRTGGVGLEVIVIVQILVFQER